jgi:hypothetical protein
MRKRRMSDRMSVPMPAAMPDEMPAPPPAYGAMPERQGQGPSRPNIDFAGMYAKGESPRGLRAETANGTASDQGAGWNRDDWSYRGPQALEGGPWQGGPSNRSGE